MARRKRRQGCLGGVILAAALVFLFLQFYLPLASARLIAREFRAAYAPQGDVAVRVRSFPFTKLAAGQFDFLNLQASGVQTDTVRLERLTAELSSVRLDLGRLRRGDGFAVRELGQARVVATVTEAGVNDYFRAHLTDIFNLGFEFHPGSTALAGQLRFAGRLLDFFATGVLLPESGNRIAFRVDSVALAGVELPNLFKESVQALFAGTSFPLGQTGWLERLSIASVSPGEGYVEIVLTAAQ